MFCSKCGKQIVDDAKFCDGCGQPVNSQQTQYQQPNYQQPQQNSYFNPQTVDNRKTYSILAYISILWLIGLCVNPEKNDARVRFNVGQGIILTIFEVGLSFAVSIINMIIAAASTPISIYGFAIGRSHPAWATAIESLLSLGVFAFSVSMLVIGIINVAKDQDKPLPLIGRFAFYK